MIDNQAVPSCWNCDQPMSPAKDVYGVEGYVCPACEVSSEDLGALPDLPRAWRVEEIRADGSGEIRAVLVCSATLEDHLWIILDRTFMPPDARAQYYPEELPELDKMSLEDLREVHRTKLEFPGCRIVQEGSDREETGKLFAGVVSQKG